MIPPTKTERMDAESAAIKLLQDAGRARRAEARRELCPVCGERVTDTGRRTTNGRTIFSCGDAAFRSKAEARRARTQEPA